MRREKRSGADLVVQVLDDAPGEAQPIERAGAAANLVQDDQAARRSIVQDVRRLAHLDHESGLSTRQIVAGADAGKNAIHQADARLRCGNE